MNSIADTSLLEARYWALCLLAAAEGAGLCPVKKEYFHGYFFLASALAPTYHERGMVGVVMKHDRGPYYPELDWHLTRLCVEGCVTMSGFKVERDKKGAWTHYNLALRSGGAQLVTQLRQISLWERRYQFFTDMLTGLARLHSEKRMDTAVQQDENYARPGMSNRQVARFFDRDSNYSVRTMDRLRASVPDGLGYSQQDLLRTYAALLDLKAA